MKTIFGTFKDSFNNPVAGGRVFFKLSQDAVATGVAQIAPLLVSFNLDSVGSFSGLLWFNDELTPSGTIYTVSALAQGGSVAYGPENFSITGASPFNLNTATPSNQSGVIFGNVVLQNPVGSQNIVQPGGSSLGVNRLEQIRFADQFSGADGGAKINAADADLGSAAGEIWVNQDIGISWTTAVTISANHVLRFIQGGTYTSSASPMITLAGTGGAGGGASAIGTGTSTILQTSSGTADIIKITGNICYVANLTLRSSVIRTAGAGINCQGGGAFCENLEINPVWNGIQSTTSSSSIGGKNILMRQGAAISGANNAGIILGGMTSGAPSTDMFFSQCQIVDSASFPFADATIVLDAGLDTIRFTDIDAESVAVPALKLRFSGGSLDVPRLIRFTACAFECASAAPQVVEATAYKDVRFDGCVFNLGTIGVHINGSTNGKNLTIMNSLFSQPQQNAAKIESGVDTYIINCTLSGASQASNGGFDSILVSANVNQFYLEGNNFNDLFTYTNHPNFNIKITAGTSTNYTVVRNTASSNVVTGLLSDGGTGADKTIGPNFPSSNLTTFKSTLNIPSIQGPGFQFQKFTSTGANTFTIPAGVIQTKAIVVGAGGAGGGASAVALGTGGGSGSVAVKYFTGLTPGNTIIATVGTGGTGSSSANGNPGGNSTLTSGTQTITTVTANGGGGGIITGNDVGGAPGAISTNGDINLTGTPGEAAAVANNFGGNGGATPLFGGGALGAAGSTAGAAGTNPGCGGSGAGLGANNAGGAGANGFVIFEWVS